MKKKGNNWRARKRTNNSKQKTKGILIKDKFDETKELSDEIDRNDLIYFQNNTATKDCNDFENGIELFRKIK